MNKFCRTFLDTLSPSAKDHVMKAVDLNFQQEMKCLQYETMLFKGKFYVTNEDIINELHSNAIMEKTTITAYESSTAEEFEVIVCRSKFSWSEKAFIYTWCAIDEDGNQFDCDTCDFIFKVTREDHFNNKHLKELDRLKNIYEQKLWHEKKQEDAKKRYEASVAEMPPMTLNDIWPSE
jgi:hypothetical protein